MQSGKISEHWKLWGIDGKKKRKTQRNGKITRYWISRINIIKMYTTPMDLQIQCNPYQNSNDIFHRNRKYNTLIHMKPQPWDKNIWRH